MRMNVVFLANAWINTIEERGIYPDLLRKFRNEGHDVTIIVPAERRLGIPTNFKKVDGATILQVKTLNVTKNKNFIEKGLGMIAIEYQFLYAIKKFFSKKRFDLILYATPPITLVKVVSYLKKRDKAYTYLLLKDIFPQNAVDMKMIKKGGIIHKTFLKKENKLYKLADTIGCMSPANVQYLLDNNPDIDPQKIEENPNSIQPVLIRYSENEKKSIREKYNIPPDKIIFVYGGNLGIPQGLGFLIDTIETTENEKVFFLIVGTGTEYDRIKKWYDQGSPKNAKLLHSLPKADYDKLLATCDVGMICLHKDFLIPNFPSRLLSYLEMSMPVLAATDPNTDIGDIIEEAGCGCKVLSGDHYTIQSKIQWLLEQDLKKMGANARKLLMENYTVDRSYNLIIDRIEKEHRQFGKT